MRDSTDELRRLADLEAVEWLEAVSDGRADLALDQPTADGFFLDWDEFWSEDRSEPEWLYEDVLPRGKGTALFAKHKTGKSLLILWVALQLATGDEPVIVVHLDWEMTEDDLQERLEDMGYGADTDLSRFHYALLPTLPPLDTPEGAAELDYRLDQVQAQHPDHHLLVVVDTLGRAVEGAENESDTFRAFYNHTGIRLKRRGCTYARLDHAGKDASKGQRGSSGKGDDVDLIWKLVRTDAGIDLTHGGSTRVSWAPPRVSFQITEDPVLTYRRIGDSWPAGTQEVADELDRLEVAPDASGNEAFRVLRDNGGGHRRALVLKAQQYRRQLAR